MSQPIRENTWQSRFILHNVPSKDIYTLRSREFIPYEWEIARIQVRIRGSSNFQIQLHSVRNSAQRFPCPTQSWSEGVNRGVEPEETDRLASQSHERRGVYGLKQKSSSFILSLNIAQLYSAATRRRWPPPISPAFASLQKRIRKNIEKYRPMCHHVRDVITPGRLLAFLNTPRSERSSARWIAVCENGGLCRSCTLSDAHDRGSNASCSKTVARNKMRKLGEQKVEKR